MLKNICTLMAILITLGNMSCNSSEPNEKGYHQDSAIEDLTLSRDGIIKYDIKTFRAIGTDPKNRKKIISEVHIKYPDLQSKNSKFSTNVQSYISNLIEGQLKDNMTIEDTAKAKSIGTASKAFIQSCKAKREVSNKEHFDEDQVWYCDIIGNVEMQSGNHLTLRFQNTSYTGGAHGNYGEDYATFNLKTGKKLEWADIIYNKERFIKLAELRFKQVNGLNISKSLNEEEGFSFPDHKFSLSDNFALTNDGLIIYYQPYQVAPFSFGATKLLFKYFEISDYLNPLLFGEPL